MDGSITDMEPTKAGN